MRVELGATSNVFRAGHRIRLDIAGSNFPKYGRNSQTGGVIHEEVALEKAVTTIHAPSYAVLPIVDRAGA